MDSFTSNFEPLNSKDLEIEIILNYGPRICSPRNLKWHFAHCSCAYCVNPNLKNKDHEKFLKNFAAKYKLKMKCSPLGIEIPNSFSLDLFISELKKESVSYKFLDQPNQSPRGKSPSQLKFKMNKYFSTQI